MWKAFAKKNVLHASYEMPERYFLDLPANGSFRDLTQAERVVVERRYAWLLRCRKVTVHSDPMDARKGWINVYRESEDQAPDYPSEMGSWPGWPGTGGDFSQPVPVGIQHRTHRPTGITLVTEGGSKNLLVFGFPGSGKSVAAAQIIAWAAQDPSVDIRGADGGGGTDLEFWRDRMSRLEVLPEKVFLMLWELDMEIKARSAEMVASRRRKIDPYDPKILFVMEEFATFTDDKTKRSYDTGFPCAPKEPGEKMQDVANRCIRLGRKYGIGFLLVTQSPTVDTIPGKIRRNCQLRWGLRTPDPQGWRAGMGPGIPFVKLERPGDGVLMDETGHSTRLLAYYLTDENLEAIAAATSLAPVDSLAPDRDTIPAELCLESGDFPVAPSESTDSNDVAPIAAPAASYVCDAWDLAVLTAACFYPRSGPDLYNNLVEGLSGGAARKRLVAMERMALLSSPPRASVTDPKLYLTTLEGRAKITAARLSNIPDGARLAVSAESDHQPSEGKAL